MGRARLRPVDIVGGRSDYDEDLGGPDAFRRSAGLARVFLFLGRPDMRQGSADSPLSMASVLQVIG